MNRSAAVATLGLALLVASAQGCRRHTAPPLGLERGPGGPIAFPPPDPSWTDREPLPPETNAVLAREGRLAVSEPKLDGAGHFEFSGQTLRLSFNGAAIDGRRPKDAPALAITPKVKGKTEWTSDEEVRFVADKPFDPEVAYEVALPELVSPSGHKLEGGFKATFHAKPQVEIAGKTIGYVPAKGRARPIVMRPSDADKIGGPQEVTVLYDQPIDLGLAQRLVSIKTDDDVNVPVALRHPNAAAFEGQKVDARYLVVAKPRAPLAPGAALRVDARAEKEGDEDAQQSYSVADPPKIASIACNQSSECDVTGTRIRAPSTASLVLQWNNPLGLGWSDGAKFVTVTPKPKSLYVNGWGDLTISASFAPSTTYTITLAGLVDRYGGAVPSTTLTFVTLPLPASATLSEGVSILDESAVKALPITTRNVADAELALWALPKDDAKAFTAALHASSPPSASGDPIVVAFRPKDRLDELVETTLDLGARLERGRAYVAEVRIVNAAHGAKVAAFAAGTAASRPAMGILFAAGSNALAAHVHRAGDAAVVQIFRLAGGEPVVGARVALGAATATTDALGTARLDGTHDDDDALVAIADDASLVVPLSRTSTTSASLFPDLGARADAAPDRVGMLVTDRGVYRPGSKMSVKGFVRKMESARIAPVASERVRLRVIDPMNTDVADDVLTTNERGVITREVAFDKKGATGRFQVRLELDDGKHTAIAEEQIRVAAFEPPKFKVDVDAENAAIVNGADGAAPAPPRLRARVQARYLFGAPMDGAKATWVLKKSPLPVNGGAFAEAGLAFEREASWSWWEDAPKDAELKPVTGEGVLGEGGVLAVDVATAPLAEGPTELVLEADVTDASNRHVAGRARVVRDPFAHHAGVKLSRRFGGTGQPLRVDVAVVDANGKTSAGVKVAARLEKLAWTKTSEKAASGALVERWKSVPTPVTQCDLTSGVAVVSCELPVDQGGDYRVVTVVDGRDDASVSYWAWGGALRADDARASPSNGKKVPLVLDKAKYKAGETAEILAQSPWPKAIALLTVEQGGILRHETKRVDGASVTFDVPLTAANMPWVHAAVTLLPVGETDAELRIGAVRIPVGGDDAKLAVKVASAKAQYDVKDVAEITVEVKRGGAPVKNADVTLAVVDEGVLRLTAFHAKDPATALRPGKALAFRAADSRLAMMRRREKAHTAGGGDSEGEDELDTRKSFVETAAWLPDLVTDDKGRATAKIKLPDNLTEFRMTAVVVDDDGAGGVAESSFVVTKALLLEPILPRFALRGDTFEAAAMAHNNTDAPVAAKVTVAGETRDVTLAPRSRQRVAVKMRAETRGTKKMRFALEAGGRTVDRVELPLVVDEPGILEHPVVTGVFGAAQRIDVAIPGDAVFEDGAALSIKTGSALYPELGRRLSYLLDYPHGCVEQTTSRTLPLLAARTILPWTGATTMEDVEIKKRITAGVDRLATMTTASGGLAYWPGGYEPNVFGTAYAMRALLRAKEAGIERPKLIEGVTKYLVTQLGAQSSPGLRVSIAEVLGRAGALPESAADSLYDTREKLDAFGLASLAIALASVPKQEDRVAKLLDALEASFDASGDPKKEHDEKDWYWWGSGDRDRAQATIALVKLRKGSLLVPVLAGRLARGLERWTTQSTAWSLVALADYVGARDPDGGVDVEVKLEGHFLDTYRRLGGDNKEVRVPLKDLAGKKVSLFLGGNEGTPSAFSLEATYKRPIGAPGTHAGKRAKNGVSIHRAYSDTSGKAIDLAHVKAGQVVRVAVRAELPTLASYRLAYVALVDRLPGGLEAIDPDLATTGSLPELAREHPYYDGLTQYGRSASHVDLRDDRVNFYFDHVYGGRVLYATYLARATTPGTFAVPPADGELMYEPESEGWSDATSVTIE